MVSAITAQPWVCVKMLPFSFIPGLNRTARITLISVSTNGGSQIVSPYSVARRSRTDCIARAALLSSAWPLSTAQDCGLRKIEPSLFSREPNLKPSPR